MKVSPLRVAILASLVASGLLSNQAFAQSKKQTAAQSNAETQALITELKTELEHQKQIAAEQQERLEALESKLNATLDVQTAMAENDAKEKKDAPKLKLGEGISVTNDKDEVKLYGLIDLTVRSRSNADKNGNSLRDITSGYLSGSRWGIQGSHKLPYDNDSMKAIYKLESEYNMRDGSMDTPNVLFNRDAWIGLESDTLGRVTIGRQNTLGRDFAEAYGIPFAKPQLELTEGGWSNNNVSKNGIYYVGAATGTRYDGGIVWKRKFGNFIGGVAYQLGGEVGKFSHNTSDAIALAYNGESFTLSSEYNESKISNLHHRTYTFGGNYRFTPEFRVNAGYYHYEAEQNKVGKRKDDNYVLSASYSPDGSKFNYYLSWESAKANNAGYASNGYTLLPFKDTSTVTKAGTGNRDAYAATVIYKVDKRLDFYAFSEYMKTRDGYRDSVTNGYHGTVEIGGGMRLRF